METHTYNKITEDNYLIHIFYFGIYVDLGFSCEIH